MGPGGSPAFTCANNSHLRTQRDGIIILYSSNSCSTVVVPVKAVLIRFDLIKLNINAIIYCIYNNIVYNTVYKYKEVVIKLYMYFCI